jgi:hypothetical protein
MPQLAALSPLQILIAALPPEVLRAALLAVLSNGVTVGAAKAAPDASHVATSPPQAHRGWPKGVPRGKRLAAAAPAAADPKKADRLARNAARRRDQRAAARAGKASNGAGNANGHGKPGNGKGSGTIVPDLTPAQAVWRHAMALQPKFPWRLLSREFGTNEAQALDCYRRGELPPGLDDSALARFVKLPVPAG